MDLYLLSNILVVVALVALLVVAALLWRDERESKRRMAEIITRLNAANTEVPQRPRVRFPSPLPTLER